MVKEIEFESEGATLRGRLYLPEAEGPWPVVIMAHGTSATITMVSDKYAESFARAGIAALLYDHRNFGRSGGEPRQEINPWVQSRGYRAAMDFAEAQLELRSDAMALWGDSYTGGQVVVVAAVDERVKAVVAQCPAFGAQPSPLPATRERFEVFAETLRSGNLAGAPHNTVGPMPVVSSDQGGTPSLLTPIQAFRWFIDQGGRAGSYWENRVSRVLPDTPVPFHPGLCAPFCKAPTMLMVAPEDEMIGANYQVARHAYDQIPASKEWHDIDGGHFGLLYHPGETFDLCSGLQADFLKRTLLS